MTIFVDGKEQELTAVNAVSGDEWTKDLLDSYDALHYDEDHEIYTMSQEDFEWWQPVVEKLNKISELEDALTPEDREIYYQAQLSDPDLEKEADQRMIWLQEHFAELEKEVKAENMEHIKYELIENTREVHYKDRAEIKKGCTRDQTDQNPEIIKSFDSKDEALEALKDYKSEILEFSSHGMIYFNVKEFYVEENVYDRDGEWISGGDVWEFSEMPIAELIKARPEIVSSTDISASDLEIMSKDEAAEVREAVAGNKNTPVSVLEELSKDEDIVRINVARNKNTPVNVLEELSKDPDEDVREAANKRLENQHYISASDLREAKAEKDVRDAAAPKQEQKQKAQEQGLE